MGKIPEKFRNREQILHRFGPHSEQFREQVWGLVQHVLNRHLHHADDPEHFADSLQEAYGKVLKVLTERPFDPGKGNIGSYIYRIARNEASNINHRMIRDRRYNVCSYEDWAAVPQDSGPFTCANGQRQLAENEFEPVIFRRWDTVLGAYVSEAEDMLRQVSSGSRETGEILGNPEAVEAARVHLWEQYTIARAN